MKSCRMAPLRPTILIDFDGPLVDVSHRYHHVHHETLSRMGHSGLAPAAYWDLKRNRTPEQTIARLAGAESISDQYAAQRSTQIETESSLSHDRLQPHALRALDFLAEYGDLVLVTLRTRRDLLEQQLRDWGLMSHFSLVLSGDYGLKPRWLIKQRMVNEALPGRRHLAIIGDTETDILAGKSLGCRTIAVLNGIRSETFLAETQPDHMVADLASVCAEHLAQS